MRLRRSLMSGTVVAPRLVREPTTTKMEAWVDGKLVATSEEDVITIPAEYALRKVTIVTK